MKRGEKKKKRKKKKKKKKKSKMYGTCMECYDLVWKNQTINPFFFMNLGLKNPTWYIGGVW